MYYLARALFAPLLFPMFVYVCMYLKKGVCFEELRYEFMTKFFFENKKNGTTQDKRTSQNKQHEKHHKRAHKHINT